MKAPACHVRPTLTVEGCNDAAVFKNDRWIVCFEQPDGLVRSETAPCETVARRLLTEAHPHKAISHTHRAYRF